MIETVKHLMDCGFKIIYGYTESDEISLLFSLNEQVFNRKLRKYNSVLAGEASAKFSILLKDIAAFDCRISQLPRKIDVIDYFRWRNEDAYRNALNAHCYWKLRGIGNTAKEATKMIEGRSVADKNELLQENGINFDDVPNWQKRGVGFYWIEYEKEGLNPKTQEKVITKRRKINVDLELPIRDKYAKFLDQILTKDNPM